MKNRSIYASMILVGMVWMLIIDKSFSYMNAASDLSVMFGLLLLLGSSMVVPSIFVKLYSELKKVSKEEK